MQVEEKSQRKRYLEFITGADGLDGYDAHCNKKLAPDTFLKFVFQICKTWIRIWFQLGNI